MNDDPSRELLSAFIQVLETTERQSNMIRALLLAHEVNLRPAADVIQQYREQCDGAEKRIEKLRGMLLATLSRQL